eukprot:CAMPEP_0118956534 /NCGR_PEP_ID=MMETSP1169-20130426/61630_1 /TAXON_ID=36882 /ORGANISM="Pyramimonas obovata, Strain CCMP722" /LENGTH=264 /DNA_ID=CAMNT_0006904569 /DNA_START=185 /DNA_END=979 /DNA_ORIENTATION=+
MNSLPRVHTVSTESAWKKAIQRNNLVFVHFATGGADPVTKYVNQLSKQPEYRRVTFVRFDMDKLGTLAAQIGVVVAPTFRAYRSNQLLEGFAGVIPQKMLAMLDTHNKGLEKKAGGFFGSKLTLLVLGALATVAGLKYYSTKSFQAPSEGKLEAPAAAVSTEGEEASSALAEQEVEAEEEEEEEEEEQEVEAEEEASSALAEQEMLAMLDTHNKVNPMAVPVSSSNQTAWCPGCRVGSVVSCHQMVGSVSSPCAYAAVEPVLES